MERAKKLVSQTDTQKQDSANHRSGMQPRIPRDLKRAGFNAIELSLVLGVVAIAIVGVIRIMAGNTDKQNSSQMVNDVSTLVSNIKNAYSSSTQGYASLTTTAAIDGKMVPQDLRIPTGGTTIKNQFQGGEVKIDNQGGENFTITYTNVPAAICNNVINTLGGVSFLSITVGGIPVYDINAGTVLDGTNVSAECKKAGEKSTIVFTAS
jgi:type II secretory pathway pseudopilin PulG